MHFDPGFGSMLIQFILAGVAIVGAMFFTMRTKIKALFHKNSATTVDDETDDDDIEIPDVPDAPENAAENDSVVGDQRNEE